MAKLKKLKAKVEQHPQYKTPRRIYDLEIKPSKKNPAQIAEAWLKKIVPDLKIKPDLSQLKFDKVKESILGRHVLYQQYHEGRPITGAWIRVDIDKDGKVYNILNDLVPEPIMTKTKKAEGKRAALAVAPQPLSDEGAEARALEATGAAKAKSAEVLERELVCFPHKGIPTPAWKVVVKTTGPAAGWKVYLDAITGDALAS